MMPRPQAFVSEFAPRLRTHLNSLLTPVIPQSAAPSAPTSRTTKRGTVVINYSEDLLHDEDFEDGDGPRRHTGLRSRQQVDPNQTREALWEKLSQECTEPVDVQGIWRDWMGKPKFGKTDKQLHAQAALPVTLIPIRIDLDVPSFTPAQALPLPADAAQFGINPAHPAYKIPEATPPYRLKDVFLWNLHETLITPDAFALVLVNELDLPNPAHYALQISGQIRQQLEEYAGVALHPLFHSSGTGPAEAVVPRLLSANISRDQSQTPGIPSTPGGNGTNLFAQRSGNESPAKPIDSITAEAVPIPSEPGDINNPDDTYRCIVNLNINLLNKLYTDKFEWSLLHPPGFAEDFARQTCADLGLAGEWVPTMAHAIYEAVLRLKKDACENGGLVGAFGTGEIDNLAIEGQEAGWRYEPEQLAEEWEPKVEIMSKEDIERREIDRERQIRRLRRETARFSSTANMAGGVPTPGALFDQPDPDTPMGRGERSKKKRRFRSLSPQGRGGTPGGTMSDNTSYGGGAGAPNDKEKRDWRCSHCLVHGGSVWAIRNGPAGPRSLCNNCGLFHEREKRLPPNSKWLHRLDQPLITGPTMIR